MKVQIDQSWKIENTNKDTILAFANSKTHAIRIPAKVKKDIQTQFRLVGMPKLFIYRTFRAGVFLLVKDYLDEITDIVITFEELFSPIKNDRGFLIRNLKNA